MKYFNDSFSGNLEKIQDDFRKYQNSFFKLRSSQFFCLELTGEAGELANLEKKQWKGKEIPVEQFEDEAADVFIALMNYCNAKNINIEASVLKKIAKIDEKRLKLQDEGLEY